MADNLQQRYVSVFQRWSRAASGTVLLTGSLVLVGWWFNIAVLKTLGPGLTSIKANTALAFVGAGLTLLLQVTSTDRRRVLLRRSCAITVILLGLLTLSEYIFGWNLGIDELLFREGIETGGVYPGRMAPVTALNFLLTGAALLLVDVFRRHRIAQFLTLIASSFSLLAVIGYLYGVASLHRLASFTSIAMPTAVLFLVLCLGILFVNPDRGWMSILTSDSAGGVLARRLLPAAVVVPITLGWFRLSGQNAGVYDPLFSQALFTISNIIVFSALIAWNAVSLYRIDVARHHAEDSLRRLHAELEERVLERTAELTRVNQQLTVEVVERERAEAKSRALLEAAPDPIIIVNEEGVIVLVNSLVESFFGYPREFLIGQPVDTLVPERFRGKHAGQPADCFTATLARSAGKRRDLYGLRQNGSEFPVEISLSPIASAEGPLVAASIRDVTERKREEAEVRQSEEVFRLLVNGVRDYAILMLDKKGHVASWNFGAERIKGYRAEEIIGQHFSRFYLAADVERGKPAEELVIATNEGEFHEEGVRVRRDGSQFLADVTITALFDDSGELRGFAKVTRDITERKRGQQELQNLKAVLDKMEEGAQLIGFDWSYVYLNDAAASQGRRSKVELVGHGMMESYPGIERTNLFDIMQRCMNQRVSDHIENLFTFPDNTRQWFDVRIQPMPEGIFILSMDISARKQVEAALVHERDLMQALMDSIPDTIYFKDTGSRFTRINQAQARVLGVVDFQEAIGKTDADFQAVERAAESHAEEQRLFQTGQPIIDRQELVATNDGHSRWFSATKVPMLDPQGRMIGLIGISRDITKRIQAEEAVTLVNAQLTARMGQMAMLYEFVEQLQACFAFEEVYQVTVRLAGRIFPDVWGALYVINNRRNLIETAATWGATPSPQLSFRLEDCWALRRGRTHVSGVGNTNFSCGHLTDLPLDFSVCLPLLAQGETLGVLHVGAFSTSGADFWDESRQQLARVMADSVALAMANLNLRETLRQQSIRDPLTDLFNRRYMQESLDRELRRAERTRQPVGIVILDVDLFKRVNDTYGHDAGDEVLRQLGHFLKGHARGGDIVCRYGGEEFTLILPEASLDQTRRRAEQLREAVKTLAIRHHGRLLDVITLSFGVAAYPDHGSSEEEVLRAADAALYRAKQEGRDRVVVSGTA